MPNKFTFRPLPILTLFTLPLLVVLFMLGNWQWHRYEYKKHLESLPPAPALSIAQAINNPQEFAKIKLEGKIISPLINVKATEFGMYGNRYFGIINADGKNLVFEYGFVGDKEMANIDLANINKDINTTAVIRHSKKPNRFIPDNNDILYWPEVALIAHKLNTKIDNSQIYVTPIEMAPFGMKPRQNPYADEKGATYVDPARHLGYAMTWWGLLISLIIFYVALHIKNGRFRA